MRNVRAKVLINRMMIGAYSFFCGRNKHIEYADSLKEIIVIETGALGDSILFLGALRFLVQKYSSELGYQITLICRKDVRAFLESNLNLKIRIELIDVIGDCPSLKDYIDLLNVLDKKIFDRCIVFTPMGWGNCLSLGIKAREKVGLITRKRNFIYNLVDKKNYDILVKEKGQMFLPIISEKLLHSMGYEEYRAHKEPIQIQSADYKVAYGEYVLVAPMSNNSCRDLPYQIVVSVIKYVLNNLKIKVIISGREYAGYIKKIVTLCNSDNVINFAGKTDYNCFLQLISGAKFLVSADSGPIHVAAALNVPSICLTGYWEKGTFLPYDFEEKMDTDPICVYGSERKCQLCVSKKGKYGGNNRVCERRIKKGLPVLCLEDIKLEDVYIAIDKLSLRLGIENRK